MQALQEAVGKTRRARGFTQDPERVLLLLMEEVGEVAQQLKRTWSPNYKSYSPAAIAEELADVMFVLLGLAEVLGVDAAQAIMEKTAADAKREWRSIEQPIARKQSQ